jgi:hypothetical protein
VDEISRRKVLSIVAAGAGGLVAKASGLMPEIALGGAGARKIQARQLLGSELQTAVADARRNAAGGGTFRSLIALGFRPVPHAVAAVEANDIDGTHYGSMVLMDLTDGAGRRARFIHRVSPNPITGAALWSSADPSRIEVHEADAGGLRHTSTLTTRPDRSTLVEWTDGRRTVIPPRPPELSSIASAEGRAGLSAPVSDWVQVCQWICELGWEITCGLVFVVACTVCGVETLGLCIIFCAVVGIVTCYTTARTWCYTACNWVWI